MPYAHRAVIAREVLGLDEAISLGTLDYRRGEEGWQFSLDKDGIDPVLKQSKIKRCVLKIVIQIMKDHTQYRCLLMLLQEK